MAEAVTKKQGAVGIKETISSLIIAFMLAFLFRGFVIEGFVIPTGSMAPTLLGKHNRFQDERSGYNWATGPWVDVRSGQQLAANAPLEGQDPMSGLGFVERNRLAAGDRVFVLKYLPLLQSPQRWDVVVFKNPGEHINFIKRLVGLPGEQLAIVDGDVFARPFIEGQTARSGWASWAEDDWRIQRKDERTQRAMLQDVFDSFFVPVDAERPGEPTSGFRSPFSAEGAGWSGVGDNRVYAYAGAGPTTLRWNDTRPLTDRNAYNQVYKEFDLFQASDARTGRGARPFPTSDLALSANIRAGGEGVVALPTIESRGRAFRARVDLSTGSASVEMRDAGSDGSLWSELDAGGFAPVSPGAWSGVEFWHIDQALWLFVDGQLVAGGPEKGAYEWTPSQRASAATGRSWADLEDDTSGGALGVFHQTDIYAKPGVRWDFEGGGFELSRVRVQRDISYHISHQHRTRGASPEFFPTMSDDQFFMCGDNSSNSADSRIWRDTEIDAWVRQEIDDAPGVVNRDLIVGKAFVVYFPAPLSNPEAPGLSRFFSIDFGRLRWIW